MSNWKDKSSNMRLSDIYNINLNLFYWIEKDFNDLINKKIFNKHKEIEKKVRKDNEKNFVDAKLEYENNKLS